MTLGKLYFIEVNVHRAGELENTDNTSISRRMNCLSIKINVYR